MIALPPISPHLARIAAAWHMRRALSRARHFPTTDLRGPSPGESLELATADLFFGLALHVCATNGYLSRA